MPDMIEINSEITFDKCCEIQADILDFENDFLTAKGFNQTMDLGYLYKIGRESMKDPCNGALEFAINTD